MVVRLVKASQGSRTCKTLLPRLSSKLKDYVLLLIIIYLNLQDMVEISKTSGPGKTTSKDFEEDLKVGIRTPTPSSRKNLTVCKFGMSKLFY